MRCGIARAYLRNRGWSGTGSLQVAVDRWACDAELVGDLLVGVRSCRRHGVAIDLVLDRGRNNRSQIVFTTPNAGRAGGRPMIFWQTARTTQRARQVSA